MNKSEATRNSLRKICHLEVRGIMLSLVHNSFFLLTIGEPQLSKVKILKSYLGIFSCIRNVINIFEKVVFVLNAFRDFTIILFIRQQLLAIFFTCWLQKSCACIMVTF